MSLVEEIPAFSIWKTFSETIPALMNSKPSEKNAEHLAKIIKSGDFSNIFVYDRDPSLTFDKYQDIANRYKSFTTWVLGHFFYLLSHEKLSRSHNVYVDIQLCILDLLSKTQLNIYHEMAKEYSNALNTITNFIKTDNDKVLLKLFVPTKHDDLNQKLQLEPFEVEINKNNCEAFLSKILKFLRYILHQDFDFQSFDSITNRNLNDLLFLLSESSFVIKMEILTIYVELLPKLQSNHQNPIISYKMDTFSAYFEQITYETYNEKIPISPNDLGKFEDLLSQFLEYKIEGLPKISDFLLNKSLKDDNKLVPSRNILNLCKSKRTEPIFDSVNFEKFAQNSLINYDTVILCGLKREIMNEINHFRQENEGDEGKICVNPGKWEPFYRLFMENLDRFECGNPCRIDIFFEFFNEVVKMLNEIRVDQKKFVKVFFFPENSVFVKILSILNRHFSSCQTNTDFVLIFDFFLNFSFVCNSSFLIDFFNIYSYIFTNSVINNEFRGIPDYGRYKKELRDFLTFLISLDLDTNLSFDYLTLFLARISNGLLELPQIQDMEMTFLKICQSSTISQNIEIRKKTIRNLPHFLTTFHNTDRIVSEILIPGLSSNDEEISKETAKILGRIICMASADFVKLIRLNSFEIEYYCEKCNFENTEKKHFAKGCLVAKFAKIDLDLSNLSGMIVKSLLKYLTLNDVELKLLALEVLPSCSNHILKFYSGNIAKIWVEIAGDEEEIVRRKFGEVATKIVEYSQEKQILSDTIKDEIIRILFASLLNLTKKSLRQSHYKLQETILYTIQQFCNVKVEKTVLPIVKILIYLIMVPTSRHSLIAVNKFFKLAEKHKMTTNEIYKQYKNEICELIVHLCVVNQALVDYSLSISLGNISATLGFYNAKDFVSRECQYLLPFFVSKVIRTGTVSKLIEETALMVNSNLSELLASIYGNIFLHVYLNETKADLKQYLMYVEKTTGLTGPTLRKRNLSVILNELLLNFHEKREDVLLALTLLAEEDSDSSTNNIQDYLQSRFLGLLQYFDFKLMTKNINKKNCVLLSLADLFRFMGPKHIGPLRFKIIAMLRTADCEGFPDLNCEVWDAFIKSCEIEALAPQLATVFVSILPLIRNCSRQINGIFKYLVIDNERYTKEFIKDLFFIDDPIIDNCVVQVIQKHIKSFTDCCFKEKMKTLLKYLTHETMEVRIGSLKQLKLLIQQNREELDRMILGYNGIDPIIVELIDILTLGCREKDPVLKLACGDVIGELGCVEPSHLPRRYAQNSRNFTFFLDDDTFLLNILGELARALQGEKNTMNMDRFAVAIQEILKNYEISPDESSSRNRLWKQFPEAQQELMLPLLKSRYIIAQPPKADFSSPIYGTAEGVSFQSWLYNWTQSLISSLSQEFQVVLTPCLPAMKQDHRILMQFLPHIVLHSITTDSIDNKEKSYIEIKTVTNGFVNKKKMSPEIHDVRSSIIETTAEEIKQIECTKVIFIILDFLDRWIREWQWQKESKTSNNLNYVKIKTFLGRFCKLQLAKCNYHCGEYPRALMYLEDYMKDNSGEMSVHLSFLAEIYAQLDEPDGVTGVTALQHTEPSIEQRILAHEVLGRLSDAAACYERIAQPLKLHHLRGLIQCYLDLDNVNTALNFARGVLDNQPEFGNMLLEMQAEPLWRLGRYEELDNLLKRPEMEENTAWGVQIGKALLSFQNGDRDKFRTILEVLKSQQVEFLGAASLEKGSYQHGYCYISRLHALNELQQVENVTYEVLLKPNDNGFVENVINNLKKQWELRIKVVQESVRIIEPLLCLRRVALEQSKRIIENKAPNAIPLLNSLLGECWLLSAITARAAGVHQQAYTYTLKAEEFAPPKLFLEKAKLHWIREEQEQALSTLRRGLEIILPDSSKEALNALSIEKKKMCAEAKLLIASYNDSMSNVSCDVIKANYKEAVDVYKEWEKSFVCLAQYYDRIYQSFNEEDRDGNSGSELQIYMINFFCKSLVYGTTFIYQSMPRLLSIWFDYGTRLLDINQSNIRDERKNRLFQMTKIIDNYFTNLPTYILLTAFSQLISRICHPQKEVYVVLKSIIIRILLSYPQQTLWMMISVIKSGYSVRAKRCQEILNDSRLKISAMTKLVRDFTNLAEKLIELCNKEIPPNIESTTVSTLLRALPRLLNKEDFSEIMIPTHKFRKLVLPNPDFSTSQHNPFPNHYVHIVSIDEEITVLHSLQRPRKITFRGSDGKGYIQMLKPKDDLRKDFRLMEFNDVVNQLLSREPEARQRRLYIRLYSVSPLNEECGLIEWVPNLIGLRPILMSLYKQKPNMMRQREVKEVGCNRSDPLSKKRDVFTKILLPRHPPVLSEWFRWTFPDAQSWVFARTAYIRTTAVMSMAGYILGLGDRHGENILFDSTCGDVVHVDFNCLFNKGETFDWPEKVPFRLTHNMVSAMGPLGVEGVFRKSCACTLKVLRTNTNTLMSIVTPFVYDPLVSWPRNGSTSSNNAERTNEQAMDHIKNIELRLQGIMKKRTSNNSLLIPLSVDGQTNNLIVEAMDIDNLCQMYLGWGPYL